MPYGYIDERLLEAWFIDPVSPPQPDEHQSGVTVATSGVIDGLGRPLHLCEIHDRANDEPVGWSLAVQTAASLDVEELFVRPAYRGRGYGRTLADELITLRTACEQPLVAWIPHADAGTSPARDAVLRHAGLEVRDTDVRWAAGVATVREGTSCTEIPALPRRRPGRRRYQR